VSADAVAFFEDDEPSGPIPAEWVRVEIPGDIPRDGRGRPQIRRLLEDGREDPTTLVTYTRASSLGERLEDAFGLGIWTQRMIVWGVAHDIALRSRAQAVPTYDDKERPGDKRELRAIAEEALVICRAKTGADRGTAAHHLGELWDDGADLGHLDDDLAAWVARYAELMAGFTVHAREGFVVCDELKAAGSYDRLVSPKWPMTAPDGTVITPEDVLVDDLKTNAEAKKFGPTYAVQQPTYANGTPYTHEHGRGAWPTPGGRAPRTDWSLILHIPVESPEDGAWWWVNLTAGMELARIAAKVGELRRTAGTFLPAEPPAPSLQEAAELLPYDVPILESRDYCAHSQPSCEACRNYMNVCVECDQPTDNPDMCTPCSKAIEVQEAAAKTERTILGLIQAARTSADLVKIWERYGQDGWTPACGAAADAHLITLRVSS
jgi:hypothetical protein